MTTWLPSLTSTRRGPETTLRCFTSNLAVGAGTPGGDWRDAAADGLGAPGDTVPGVVTCGPVAPVPVPSSPHPAPTNSSTSTPAATTPRRPTTMPPSQDQPSQSATTHAISTDGPGDRAWAVIGVVLRLHRHASYPSHARSRDTAVAVKASTTARSADQPRSQPVS